MVGVGGDRPSRGGRGKLRGRMTRWLGAVLAAVVVFAGRAPGARAALRLPGTISIAVGQRQRLDLGLPGTVAVRVSGSGAKWLNVDGAPAMTWREVPAAALWLEPLRPGSTTMQLRLFGFMPWRPVRLRMVQVPRVTVGGQSIGVVLHGDGPLVVRTVQVPQAGGAVASPAAGADLEAGDVVVAAGGRPVRSPQAVSRAVQSVGRMGGSLTLTVLRHGRMESVRVHPVRSPTGRYLIGAWLVRDGASGVGTLTFYRSPLGPYGALGHPVLNASGQPPQMAAPGILWPTVISGLIPGRPGRPGEKVGQLEPGGRPLGSVRANTPVGVFGRLAAAPAAGVPGEVLPMALADQIQVGAAHLLTVLDGQEVRSYRVEITAVLPQRRMSSRGFVLRVVDPRLLSASGGIVQGMSGSPIVQDGRLVGAVTHVFVDEPARGYGVCGCWMASMAGLLPSTPDGAS